MTAPSIESGVARRKRDGAPAGTRRQPISLMGYQSPCEIRYANLKLLGIPMESVLALRSILHSDRWPGIWNLCKAVEFDCVMSVAEPHPASPCSSLWPHRRPGRGSVACTVKRSGENSLVSVRSFAGASRDDGAPQRAPAHGVGERMGLVVHRSSQPEPSQPVRRSHVSGRTTGAAGPGAAAR